MLPENSSPNLSTPLLNTFACYRALTESAGGAGAAEQGLGGKLLYIGELDEQGRAVAIAGNVAGCATLAATADPEAQKLAVRDGVVDFLVTSLDEALRILKNEIRKHATVAVCVGSAPHDIEREMQERGVEPDLTRQSTATLQSERDESLATVLWQVESSPARWLPKIDAIALTCIDPTASWVSRWIRLSPRYLGRVAPGQRMVALAQQSSKIFLERLGCAFDKGEIGVAAKVWINSATGSEEHRFQLVSPR